MKNSFSVDYHFTLDLDDSIDMYLYVYLLHFTSLSPGNSQSNIFKQTLFSSALSDKSFMSLDDFLDKFCDNSEVNVNELFNMSNM